MSTNYKRIAIEVDLIDDVTTVARKATHIDDLAEGRCVEWLFGEYKRLKKLADKAAAQTEPLAA